MEVCDELHAPDALYPEKGWVGQFGGCREDAPARYRIRLVVTCVSFAMGREKGSAEMESGLSLLENKAQREVFGRVRQELLCNEELIRE
jgi:hypothetical protein